VRVAVTGGAGQLGTHVLRRLLADRRVKEVRCLDLRPPRVPLGRRLTFTRADVRAPELGLHLQGADVVIHLAFIIVGRLPRAELDAVNVGGSRNVFEAAARAGVRRIIYTSSIAAYGVVPGHPVPILEDTPRVRDDRLPYAAAKHDVEAFLDGFEARHPELAVVRLRPGLLVGERMEHPLGTLLRLGVLPDAGLALPLVWDEDVADAVIRSLEGRGAYNLVAAEPLPARELARAAGLRHVQARPILARALVAATGLLGRPAVDPSWAQRRDGVVLVASTDRARRELGWAPRHATAAAVLRHLRQPAPRWLDPRLEVFFGLVALVARYGPPVPEARHVTARIHVAITGPRGGDVELTLDDGELRVGRGTPRPPTAVLRLPASTLVALLTGATDLATAHLTGKILVEGEPVAALVLGAILNTFRAQRERRGVPGVAARGLTRWLEVA
jgi:UDP-glucose 4-epimerase